MVQDFKRAFDPLPPPVFPKVEIIEDADNIESVLRKWLSTEFTSSHPILNGEEIEIVCAGFSRQPENAVVLAGEGLAESSNRKSIIRNFYGRADIKFIWHNGKSDTSSSGEMELMVEYDEDTHLLKLYA